VGERGDALGLFNAAAALVSGQWAQESTALQGQMISTRLATDDCCNCPDRLT
jgi:hypothetical protein